MPIVTTQEYLTVKEAAEILGRTERRVYQIKAAIEGFQRDRREGYLFPREAVERYLNEQRLMLHDYRRAR